MTDGFAMYDSYQSIYPKSMIAFAEVRARQHTTTK
jgi:hypothetical protein